MASEQEGVSDHRWCGEAADGIPRPSGRFVLAKIVILTVIMLVALLGLFVVSGSEFLWSVGKEKPVLDLKVLREEIEAIVGSKKSEESILDNANSIQRQMSGVGVSIRNYRDYLENMPPLGGGAEDVVALRFWRDLSTSVAVSYSGSVSNYTIISVDQSTSSFSTSSLDVEVYINFNGLYFGEGSGVNTSRENLLSSVFPKKEKYDGVEYYLSTLDRNVQLSYIDSIDQKISDYMDYIDGVSSSSSDKVDALRTSLVEKISSVRNTDVSYITSIFNRALAVFGVFLILSVSLRMIVSEIRNHNSMYREYSYIRYFMGLKVSSEDYAKIMKVFWDNNGRKNSGNVDGDVLRSVVDSFGRFVEKTKGVFDK